MKNTLTILFLLAWGVMGFAQTGDPPSEKEKGGNKLIEFSAGYSIPVGSFASTDAVNFKKAGFATGGFLAQGTFTWMGQRFGMGIRYAYQRNPMEHAATLAFPRGGAEAVSGSWNNHSLMGGPVYRTEFNRWVVDAAAMGGFHFSSSRAFDTPDPTDTTGYSIHSNIGTGFALQLSAGAGYKVTPALTLKFSVNLTMGWPSKTREYGAQLIGYFDYVDPETGLTYKKPVYSAPIQYEIRKTVTTVTPAFGIVYQF